MAKKRVHEIAKAQGLSSKELLGALKGAGIEAKAAASSVEEADALKAIQAAKGDGGAATATATKPQPKRRCRSRQRAEAPKPAPSQRQARFAGLQRARCDPLANPLPAVGRRRRGKKRRVVIDSQAARRDQMGGPPPQRPPRRRGGRRRRPLLEEPPPKVEAAEPEATKVPSGATVREVAELLGLGSAEVIKKLMTMGEMATLTQTLTDESISAIADEYDRKIEIVTAADEEPEAPEFEDAEEELADRPPVVTIMGHVDHGKTSLLDAIRETEVAAGEAGGITQHIGAYQVHHDEKTITFLDTPGHAAFTAMRARGAKVTDIAVVVVAADDGVMPQTKEAIDHARAADVPILIAVNKIDKEGAQPDRVRNELAADGLTPEDWGGETVYVDVSAKTHEGLDKLLEMILLVTELEELGANPDAPASGTVVESQLDPGPRPRGHDPGPARHAGGRRLAGRRAAVGPGAGDARLHRPAGAERRAGDAGRGARLRRGLRRRRVRAARSRTTAAPARRPRSAPTGSRPRRWPAARRARSASRRSSRASRRVTSRSSTSCSRPMSPARWRRSRTRSPRSPRSRSAINIIHSQTGGINESDVMLASASDAIIIGFNVRPLADARRAAEREGVDVRTYSVIYKITEDLRNAMEGMLEAVEVEETLGEAEIKQTFKASKVGRIAGCIVTEGKVARDASVRLIREGTVIWDGKLGSLRRFKDNVQEVEEGQECGIVLDGYADVKEGDMLEFFKTKQVEQTLE